MLSIDQQPSIETAFIKKYLTAPVRDDCLQKLYVRISNQYNVFTKEYCICIDLASTYMIWYNANVYCPFKYECWPIHIDLI